jgi:hypothetical protein
MNNPLNININMKLVASMTTIPQRIGLIKKTIISLNNQTRKMDAIYVNIPYMCKNMTYDIPQWMTDMNNITIIRCDDYGPITKLIPALLQESDPNTCIITVDDDVELHKDWSLVLENYAYKYPNSAIGLSGICMGSSLFFWQYNDSQTDHPVDVLEGVWTVLYRKGFFDTNELLSYIDLPENINIKQELIKNDDHWISSYLGFKNINKMTINQPMNKYVKLLPIKNIAALHNRLSIISDHYKLISSFIKKGIYKHHYKWYKSMSFYIITGFTLLITIIIILRNMFTSKYNTKH